MTTTSNKNWETQLGRGILTPDPTAMEAVLHDKLASRHNRA
jgi:hypothetical protein